MVCNQSSEIQLTKAAILVKRTKELAKICEIFCLPTTNTAAMTNS